MTTKTDVAIIGAGPCGLFQVFELGLLDLKAQLIDALDKVGGQCAELYPEKPIYDIPAYPVIGALELVEKLQAQIKPFAPALHLGEQVSALSGNAETGFELTTTNGKQLSARAVVIAGGVGAFQPVLLKLEGIERYEGSQLFYSVRSAAQHHGKHVVVLGGGDSALDWALALVEQAASVTLIHRSEKFRAQDASVAKMRALAEANKMRFLTGHVHAYQESGGRLSGLSVKNLDGEVQVPAEQVLVFFGLSPKLGPIADWGLNLNKHQIEVDTEKFETSIPGIYAVGDINHYPGKKKLILSGFHEAALAAFAIKHRLYPDEKIHLQYTTTSPAVHKKLGVPD